MGKGGKTVISLNFTKFLYQHTKQKNKYDSNIKNELNEGFYHALAVLKHSLNFP